MSTRGDIINNLVAALASISTANGYSCDIASGDDGVPFVFYRAFTEDEVFNIRTPAISIVDGNPESPVEQIGDAHIISTPITLDVILRADAIPHNGLTILDIYNAFLGDLRKCLHSADLGENSRGIMLGDINPFGDTEERSFTYQLSIEYIYLESNP
jgi:hypothetical protein